MSFEVISNNY